jgi:hypothetical protein
VIQQLRRPNEDGQQTGNLRQNMNDPPKAAEQQDTSLDTRTMPPTFDPAYVQGAIIASTEVAPPSKPSADQEILCSRRCENGIVTSPALHDNRRFFGAAPTYEGDPG